MKVFRSLGTVGLIVLLLADIALVVLVMTRKAPQTARPAVPVTTATPTQSATATSTKDVAALVPGLLAAVDSSTAYSARSGACAGGGAALSVTTNGGQSWKGVKTQPFEVLTRLDASSSTNAFVVGGGTDCKAAVRSTKDRGQSWTDPSGVDKSWGPDPLDPQQLHSTVGTTSEPCGTRSIASFAKATDSAAFVLCDSGAVLRTVDTGETWVAGPSVAKLGGWKQVLSLTVVNYPSAPVVLVAAFQPGCAGAVVFAAPAGGAFKESLCVGTEVPARSPVALATQADKKDTAWLLLGSQLWSTSGDLTEWSKGTSGTATTAPAN